MSKIAPHASHSEPAQPKDRKSVPVSCRLRIPTKRYHLLHERYADTDREDIRGIAAEFAKVWGIGYEKIKVGKNSVSFQIDDSDFYGNATSTTGVPLWILLRWARLYAEVEYYSSPHINTQEVST